MSAGFDVRDAAIRAVAFLIPVESGVTSCVSQAGWDGTAQVLVKAIARPIT